MRIQRALLSVFVLLAGQNVLATDDAKTGARLAELVGPYVDDQTLLIAHLDLMAFDPMQTVDLLSDRIGLPRSVRDRLQANAVLASVLTQTLPRDSNVDIFVVVSLSDLGHIPLFVVLPAAERGAATAIAVEVRREAEKSWRRRAQTSQMGKALITGSPETIERLKHDLPVARPEIEAALAAAGDSALRIVFVPTADIRHFVATLLRRLPTESRAKTFEEILDSAAWISVGVKLPPEKFSVHAVIQADSVAAARILQNVLSALATTIERWAVRNSSVRSDEERDRLLPAVEGDRLTLELTEDDRRLDDLWKLCASWAHYVGDLISR